MPAETPMPEQLHIVFGLCPAETIRLALRQSGCRERVVAYPLDLSYGPIAPPTLGARRRWQKQELGREDDVIWVDKLTLFWRAALRPTVRPVVWASRCCASDWAGFLNWLSRTEVDGFDIIDVSAGPLVWSGNAETFCSTGSVPADVMVTNDLLDRASPVSPAQIAEWRADWRTLQSQDAPLRLITAGGLMSAPLAGLDDRLLTEVDAEWRKGSRIVGGALASWLDDGLFQTGDVFLAARVRVARRPG